MSLVCTRLPQAWMRVENGFAMICAWCPDKETADALATERGMAPSHGICDSCRVREDHAALFLDTTLGKSTCETVLETVSDVTGGFATGNRGFA